MGFPRLTAYEYTASELTPLADAAALSVVKPPIFSIVCTNPCLLNRQIQHESLYVLPYYLRSKCKLVGTEN